VRLASDVQALLGWALIIIAATAGMLLLGWLR
jgi:hypothetical protein